MSDSSPPPPEVLEHATFVRRLAFHLLRDDVDADDAAQETLAKAIERPPRPGPLVRTWLAAVLRNVVRRRRRTTERVERRERVAARPDAIVATDDAAARREIFEIVTDAVRGLDSVHREVVLLRHYEGLAPRDIATRLDVPVATVKSRLARAHDRLRARLDESDRGNVGHWRAGLIALVGLRWLDGTASASATGAAASSKGGIAMGVGAKSAVVGAAVLLAALAFWRFGGIDPSGSRASDEGPGAKSVETGTAPQPKSESGATLAATPAKSTIATMAGPSISGRVVDAKGVGVAGANVVSASDTNASTFSIDDVGTKGVPAFRSATDADGRFVVSVEKGTPFHTVWAEAKGFALTAATPVTTGADVTITLERSFALVGTVTSLDGAPIVGAHVKALWLVDAVKLVREAVTVEGGAYRIDNLIDPSYSGHPQREYGVFAWVEARADGYAPVLVQDEFGHKAATERRIDLTLSKGARLAGRILRAENGEPVGGATVVLCSNEGMMGMGRHNGVSVRSPYGPRPLYETTSAPDGSYSFDHVPGKGPNRSATGGRGPTVAAWKRGFAAAAENLNLLDDESELTLDLPLWPSATITGRIVEADGSIVRGAHVSADAPGRTTKGWIAAFYPSCPLAYAKSGDSDGRFRIEAAPVREREPADVAISVWVPNSPGVTRPERPASAATHVSLKAGETIDVGDIALAPVTVTPSIPVHVRTADGTPVAGASVGSAGSHMRFRTDANGVALLPWTSPKSPGTRRDAPMTVLARGFAPTPWTLASPPVSLDPVTIVLLPSHRLAGRVAVPPGETLTDIYVVVGDGSVAVESVFPPREIILPTGQVPRGRALPILYSGIHIDADGRFSLEDLPDGPYHVAATRQRRIPTLAAGTWVTAIVPNVRADTNDLVIQFPADDSPPIGSISGRVTDRETGKRLRDPTVTVLRDGLEVGRISADGDVFGPQRPGTGGVDGTGLFTLKSLPVGTYRLVASAGGHRAATFDGIEIRDGETTAMAPIPLERGTSVVGRVTGPEGADWKGRRLRFVQADATPPEVPILVALGADGSFRSSGFRAGAYAVTMPALSTSPDRVTYLPASGERLVVGEGAAESRFELTVAEAGVIALQLNDDRLPPAPWDAGEPAPDAQSKFGAATRVTLRGPTGALVYDQTGVYRHGTGVNSGPDASVTTLPGRYVARMDFPDATFVEEAVDLVARALTVVKLEKK